MGSALRKRTENLGLDTASVQRYFRVDFNILISPCMLENSPNGKQTPPGQLDFRTPRPGQARCCQRP